MAAIPIYRGLFTGSVVAANVTTYVQGYSTVSTTENFRKIRIRTPGMQTRLEVVVGANTITTSATIVRSRLNGANGALSASIAAGTTGSFTDLVNSDTIAAGDDYCFQIVTPATSGSITITQINTVFSAASGSANIYCIRNSILSVVSTHFLPLDGGASVLATEATAQSKFRSAGNLKYLGSRVESNSKATSQTFITRINGVDGTNTLTIAGATSGYFEDTTHSDAVAVGDLVCLKLTGASENNTTNWGITAKLEFQTSDGSTLNIASLGVPTVNANLTRYLAMSSDPGPHTTEANAKALAGTNYTASKLRCYITANTVTAASTLRFRKNGANGNQFVSITASTTGVFEDTSNTDIVLATDFVNYSLVTGATGTSLGLQLLDMLIALTVVAVQGVVRV